MKIWKCWIIFTETGAPLRNGVSFNNEIEAWRCYFSNRSDWSKLMDYSKSKGYICKQAEIIVNLED
jgi:hypothetical protein